MNFFADFIEDFANRAKIIYSIPQGSGLYKKKSKRKPLVIPDFKQKWRPEQAKHGTT